MLLYWVVLSSIFDLMKSKRIQVILPEAGLEKFEAQAKKQGRTYSNFARKLILEGLTKEEQKEKK